MRKALSLRNKVHSVSQSVSQSVPTVLCPDLSYHVDWALKTITYLFPIVSNLQHSEVSNTSCCCLRGGGGGATRVWVMPCLRYSAFYVVAFCNVLKQ